MKGYLANNKITVTGSIHTIGATCTQVELIKIIKAIPPDIVFCEAAPKVFVELLKAKDTIEIARVHLNENLLEDPTETMHQLFERELDYLI